MLWFKDDIFRQLFKNAGTLLSGNMIALVMGLISLAITARILGPTQFGILVLITTYVSIVDTVLNFQSWQALIKYGAEALEQKKDDEFKSIVKFCMSLDIFTAVLGTAVAIMFVSLVGQWLSWESEIVEMATIYSFVILFNIKGTPTGLLRLFNRFQLFAVQSIISAAIKLIGIIIIYLAGASLWSVLLLWMATTILGQILLLWLSWLELHKHGFKDTYKASLKEISVRQSGIWGFIITTNLNGSIRLGSRELDVVVVGGVVGIEGVGLYKIAKQISAIPAIMSDPLYQAIYPELSKLWAKKDFKSFKQLMIRSSLVAGGVATVIWFGFVIFGSFFIQFVFGSEYVAAQPVIVWYMLAMVIAIFGIPLQPAMVSMGRPKTTFWVLSICTFIYFPILFLLLNLLGLIGAGIAYVCFYMVWFCMMIVLENRYIKMNEM